MRKHLIWALEHTKGITPTVMPQGQRVRESEKGEGETISLLKGLPEGRSTKRDGAYSTVYYSYNSKRGGEWVSCQEGLWVAADASFHHRRKRVGAADAIGAEDLHRSLQPPQFEAEEEAVTSEKAVAKIKGPSALGEDGSTIGAKDDVHRLDQLLPALLHQRNLANCEAQDGQDPPDCLGPGW
jgi:hypothetical protein